MIYVAGTEVQNHIGKIMVLYAGQNRIHGRIISATNEDLRFEQINGPNGGKNYDCKFDQGAAKLALYDVGERIY